MDILKKEINSNGIKFYIEEEGREIARVYLYLLSNDLHKRSFGFIEDTFVDEFFRGKGIGSELVRRVIEEARQRDCYKLICTSRFERPKVHNLYTNLGFKEHGKEFRIDF